jgi:general secretion pathway protein J
MSPRRATARGFTLIEVVVALALIGLIAAALLTSLRFGQRSYEQVLRNGGASWDVFASQRLIRRLIESADAPKYQGSGSVGPLSFDGRVNEVSLLAPAPLAQGDAGFYRYQLALRSHRPGKDLAGNDLIVRWTTDLASGLGALGAAAPAEEVLIENVASVEWSYLDRGSRPDSTAQQAAWTDQWADTRHLPAMVRLKVHFHPGDSRQWPDLIVTPRITDGSSCVFDVVSQSCRSNS